MADGSEAAALRRMARGYAVDLGVAVVAVLVAVRLLLAAPAVAATPLILAQIAGAVARFTPSGLWELYQDTLSGSLVWLSHGATADPLSSLLLGLRVVATVLLAGPNAMLAAYRFGDGAETWVAIGAGGLTLVCFLLLLFGGRPSPARLLLAAMASPAIVSALSWLVQQILLDALDALAWTAAAAPWCLVCPVLCTLWWAAFPDAEHGATLRLVRSIGRWRGPGAGERTLPPAAAGPAG